MTRDDLKRIQEHRGYPSITILIETHRNMSDRLKDPYRVKELVGQATTRLLKEFDKKEVLPIAKTLDDIVSKIDYTKTLDSLVIFVNRNFAQVYNLPFKVNDQVIIDKTFETKDLVRALNKSPFYWVLALSAKPTRLFKGIRDHLDEVIDAPELRDNMLGFPFLLNYEVTSDRKWEAVAEGDSDAAYFSNRKLQFMHHVDDLISKYINENKWPLLILGTQDNRSYFSKVSKHKDLIIGQAEGDFSRISSKDIGIVTSKLMNEYLKVESEAALKLLDDAIGKNKFAQGVKEVWSKALKGHIQMLLVEKNFQIPASINKDNPESIVLYENPTIPGICDDLVDHIIDQVLATKGKVTFVEPGKLKDYGQIAAILRF